MSIGHSKPLSSEQMQFIEELLRNHNSKILTQELLTLVREKFKIKNQRAFKRKAKEADFKIKVGYSWQEYKFGEHSSKAFVQIRCQHCDAVYVAIAIKLSYRREKVEACPKCYAKNYLYTDEWKIRNSKAQQIAQNRPETLEKHRVNSRQLWIDHGDKMRAAQKLCVSSQSYKEKMSFVMRQKWASDIEYRNRVNGKGVFKHTGAFNSVVYDSKLELAFILWCRDNKKNVRRFCNPIQYIDPVDQKEHDYYPDFIIDNSTIVEVKGKRWVDCAPEVFRAKILALKEYCEKNDCSYRVVFDVDLLSYRKEAKEYHETQGKKARIVSRKSR